MVHHNLLARNPLARVRRAREAQAHRPPTGAHAGLAAGPRSVFVLLLAALSLPACFVEPSPSTLFRYECEAKEDCPEGERCSQGICQRPCSFGENADLLLGDCPIDGGYMACVQGYCANGCQADTSECPGLQSCVGLPGAEFSGQQISVCTVACGSDQPCAAGEVCVAGICTPLSLPTGTGGESGMTDGTGTGTGGTGV